MTPERYNELLEYSSKKLHDVFVEKYTPMPRYGTDLIKVCVEVAKVFVDEIIRVEKQYLTKTTEGENE